jgi:hypothetical protein
VRFVCRQRGGRFVKDENARRAVERPGDLHHLARAEGKIDDWRGDVGLESDQNADFSRLSRKRTIVDEAKTSRKGCQANILGNRQLAREAELLLHDRNARATRRAGRQHTRTAAIDFDSSAVGGERSRQQIDKGRFARTIFADQRVDAPWTKFK